MTAPFAALEARTVSAVFARLANANATLGGVQVTGIFDAAFALGSVGPFGMASNAPTLTLATLGVPANPVGLLVVVNGVSYLVAAHEPDGTGVSRLLLEVA
jgi:hypothetical protein